MCVCVFTLYGLILELEDLEITETSGDHLNNWIIEIGQNTKKSSENLRKLAITQTPVRNNWQMLVLKNLIEVK